MKRYGSSGFHLMDEGRGLVLRKNDVNYWPERIFHLDRKLRFAKYIPYKELKIENCKYQIISSNFQFVICNFQSFLTAITGGD